MLKQKQPSGFRIFFLTEMWERYGFYILQTLLVFYALQRLQLGDGPTYVLVGSFTAMAYISSIFGGLTADRYLGYDKAILSGAALLCLGYLILSLAAIFPPPPQGTPQLVIENSLKYQIVVLGLATVTVGTGMLKPNISSMLSILYKNSPQKKEIGYTLFYIGIYFGAISGSFLGGYIKTYLGWSAVFASAAIGLSIAFFTFRRGQKKYQLYELRQINSQPSNILKAGSIVLSLLILSFLSLKNATFANWIFSIISLLSLVFIIYNVKFYSGEARRKLIAFGCLSIFSVLYWAIYFQQFFSVSLCTARVTKLALPPSSLTAFESLGVILFGPLINAIWLWLQRRNYGLSIPAKFSISFLFNSLSFLILIVGLQHAINHATLLNQALIILSYLIIAMGELFIAPVGLAMVSTLVPQRLNGAMMGIFLMSIGLGGKLAGWLAQVAESETNASTFELKHIYHHSFLIYLGFSLVAFTLCTIFVKPLNKLIQGNHHEQK